mgnify:FL=1
MEKGEITPREAHLQRMDVFLEQIKELNFHARMGEFNEHDRHEYLMEMQDKLKALDNYSKAFADENLKD